MRRYSRAILMSPVVIVVGVGLLALSSPTGAAAMASHRPGVGANSTPRHGGSLVIDSVGLPSPTLDPGSPTVDATTSQVFELIYNSLFLPGPNGTYRPEMASSYTVNKSGNVYDIFLRHGILFQDGTPLNAAAVAFNLNRDLQTKSCICNSTLTDVASVRAVGTHEVQVTLTRADATFIADITPGNLAAFMVSPTALQKEGSVTFAAHPVGAGPFKVATYIPDSLITLTRWNHYWQPGKPYLDKVKMVTVGSDTSGYEDLQSGGAQMLLGAGPQVLAQARSNPDVKIINSDLAAGWTIWYNTARSPFNDKRARLALAYATDTKVIADHVFPGWLHYDQSLIAPGEFGWTGPKVPGFPTYNLARARKLVSQLGGLQFDFYSLGNPPQEVTVMDALAAQWQRAGIKVAIDPQTISGMVHLRLEGNYEMLITSSGQQTPWQYMTDWVTCASTNGKAFCDPTADHLIEKASATFNLKERVQVYKSLMTEITARDPGFLPLFWFPTEIVISPKLEGLSTQRDYQGVLDVEDMWIK